MTSFLMQTKAHTHNCSTYALPAFSLPTPWAKLSCKKDYHRLYYAKGVFV